MNGLPAGEFHSLLMFATAGMMFMASAGDLVIVFLGLEILSIATYVMCGFRRTDVRSNESSMKYFILGSFSSAFLLYGIALTYGATAHDDRTARHDKHRRDQPGDLLTSQYPLLLFAGAAMMLVGFGFKIATAPFHVWTPDVYEGAPTPGHRVHGRRAKSGGLCFVHARVLLFAFPFVVSNADRRLPERIHAAWLGALVWSSQFSP